MLASVLHILDEYSMLGRVFFGKVDYLSAYYFQVEPKGFALRVSRVVEKPAPQIGPRIRAVFLESEP